MIHLFKTNKNASLGIFRYITLLDKTFQKQNSTLVTMDISHFSSCCHKMIKWSPSFYVRVIAHISYCGQPLSFLLCVTFLFYLKVQHLMNVTVHIYIHTSIWKHENFTITCASIHLRANPCQSFNLLGHYRARIRQ